jgi:hypothetical protein
MEGAYRRFLIQRVTIDILSKPFSHLGRRNLVRGSRRAEGATQKNAHCLDPSRQKASAFHNAASPVILKDISTFGRGCCVDLVKILFALVRSLQQRRLTVHPLAEILANLR